MCHGTDDRPPPPPYPVVPPSEHGPTVLESADGNRFAGYAARAASPTDIGIVVMPDVRGLHPFYQKLTIQLAGIGVHAIAIDYFGRTAGIGDRSANFEFRPHVDKTTPQGIAEDVAAAAAYLRSTSGGGANEIFTLGFCFGGGYSWRQSADTPGLAGVIGLYGLPQLATPATQRMTAPLLMFIAGQDKTPVADSAAVAEQARDYGLQVEFVVYDDAPHSFFDRTYAEHREACTDVWHRITGFVHQNGSSKTLAGGTPPFSS